MTPFSQNPAAIYRKVDLDARIEASDGSELTLICLDEAIAALRRAEMACSTPSGSAVREPLTRAHGIAMWLCRSVAPENPLREALVQFYGGLAASIRSSMARPAASEIAAIKEDFNDLLVAARNAPLDEVPVAEAA